MDDPEDDVTTNYTKDEPRHKPLPKLSQEPIYGPPDFGKPANSIDANDEHPPDNLLDVDIPFSDLPQIPEEEPAQPVEDDDNAEDSYLPNIYATG